MESPELLKIADLVRRGLIAGEHADLCARRWQELRRAGRDVSLLAVFVQAKLLTPTQALVLARADLVQRQPFPNYRLLRFAGEGGMALVFEASYLPLKPPPRVALKVLDPSYGLDERFRVRFKREAHILLHLDHPNIVEGREYGTADGVDYYAMGFVDGVSVQHLLDRGLRLREPLCLSVAMQVADALEHMRERGIVHRDIKPGNIILDQDGHVRLIDFGLAKVMSGMWADTSGETTVGTVEYFSPEQACGRDDVDARADIYSLGVSLFQMLTGELPFRGTPDEITYGHVKRPLEFTPEQRARVSAPVQYVLRKMTAKARDERYPSGAALVAEMRALCAAALSQPVEVPAEVRQDAIESAPIAPRPATPARPAAPIPSRRPGRHGRPGR